MRKNFAYGVSVVALFGVIVVVFGQPPTPTESPTATSTPTPTAPSVLISTATPTPTPTPVPTPTITPNESGTVSVSSTLGPSPSISPSPSATPIAVQAAALGESDLGWSEKGAPVFRLDQAVITALAQNPTVLQALEEIRRTKGVIIQIRAEALPQIGPSFSWNWTDPNLRQNTTGFTTFSGGPTPVPGTGMGGIKNLRSDIIYNVQVTGSQLVFNSSTFRVRGELAYIPRKVDLLAAIEAGKRNRPFLKQQRANVLNAIEQVHVAIGSWLPNVNANGGGEWLSNQFNSSFGDVSKGWLTTVTGSWPIWDSGMAWGKIQQQRALLSEQEITYDDDVRQVEFEIQQAASNLAQNRELIQATEKNQETAEEAVRLAKARLDAGAGTQLDVLNAQVQLTTAQSTYLQAWFGYISSLAEFDRATGAQSSYTEQFNGIAPHATKTSTYYTGSDVDARGEPKQHTNPFEPGPAKAISPRPS